MKQSYLNESRATVADMFVDIYNTDKQYDIIYADPPWRYNQRNNKKTKFGGGVHAHYPTLSMEEIERLPIDKLAGDNCALFLWTTFPYLDKQIQLFKKWGFRYTTLGFSWIKTNVKNGAPFFGVGYYAKSNCEICLLGIKGKMKPISNKISSCVISPREAHSKKPSEVREKTYLCLAIFRVLNSLQEKVRTDGIVGEMTLIFNRKDDVNVY